MHKRTAIRNAIETELQNISTVDLVVSRIYAVSELPACVVTTREERNEIFNVANNLAGTSYDILRTLTLDVELIVSATSSVDDSLDTLCEAVEAQLGGNRNLGGLAIQSTLTATEIEYSGDSETPHAKATLTYEYQYITPSDNPSA